MTIGLAGLPRRAAPGDTGPRYARELVAVLVVKACALLVIWYMWFADAVPRDARPEATAAHIVPPAATPPPETARHARP